jgi:hypothetical protein
MGFPRNAIRLYDIDPKMFEELDDEARIELLLRKSEDH